MRSQNGGSTDLPRYWITLDKNVIWDYPKDFIAGNAGVRNFHGETCWYPYLTDICSISDLLREQLIKDVETNFSQLINAIIYYESNDKI